MAPERLRGTDGLPASDLFSLGVTLYQAVEGVSPFHRDTQAATLTAVLLEQAPAPRRAGWLTQLITGLLDKDPASRPTATETLTMAGVAGEQPTTHVHVRRDIRILTARETPERETPKRWQHRGVAAMMAIITALGVVGLTNPGVAWGELIDEVTDDSVVAIPFLMLIIVEAFLAGVLCAGIARSVPPGAGQTVTAVVGVAGFLFGGGATALAYDGATEVLVNLKMDQDPAWQVSPIVITIIMLVAVGWAWESRKSRRSTLHSTQAGR